MPVETRRELLNIKLFLHFRWTDEHLHSYVCVHVRMFQRSPKSQHRKGHSQPQSVSFYAVFGVTLSTNNSHN